MQEKPIDYTLTQKDTNVLKGIAICAMLWHHLFLGTYKFGELSLKTAIACKICVAIFVFLSGYGLAIQFSKIKLQKNIKALFQAFIFLSKRLIKFYLNYWIIFAISIPLGIFVFNRLIIPAYFEPSVRR